MQAPRAFGSPENPLPRGRGLLGPNDSPLSLLRPLGRSAPPAATLRGDGSVGLRGRRLPWRRCARSGAQGALAPRGGGRAERLTSLFLSLPTPRSENIEPDLSGPSAPGGRSAAAPSPAQKKTTQEQKPALRKSGFRAGADRPSATPPGSSRRERLEEWRIESCICLRRPYFLSRFFLPAPPLLCRSLSPPSFGAQPRGSSSCAVAETDAVVTVRRRTGARSAGLVLKRPWIWIFGGGGM